ncbi:hypothetical protein CRUP_009592 [Coryphaenoides rupestris]|nr:hypothetical protein CRUP_009592 [Coryphaenoides rupestris]
MPPVDTDPGKTELRGRLEQLLASNQVVVFSKSYCPYCVKVKDLFKELDVKCNVVELDLVDEGSSYQDLLVELTGQKTVPNVFVNKTHVGGCDKTMQAHKDGVLQQLLNGETYDYDLIVIGGGSGGLACSKEAAILGKKVMVLDFVVPTPKGTTWEELEAGAPGRLKVTAKSTETGEVIEEEYNTVLIAVGRDACTDKIGLDAAGVKVNPKNGKVPVNDEEQTNVTHVYAIGDILEGKWELTPCDYVNVPTTIYHSLLWPLEFTVANRDNNKSYSKIICNKLDNDRVIGFHYLGPNAGEVTQGYGVAIKCGVTKEQLDNTIGIHPTCAEIFTTLDVTKSSGGNIAQGGLGGTCVNVGCIPKKLMHQTALLGTAIQDARKYGWEYGEAVNHNWETMKTAINNYIGSLNWAYKVALRDKNVNYVNAYAEFVEPHKIKATSKRGKETMYTAAKFVLATGERPRYLGIPGDKEYCITSDDLFSLPYCPGKTLVIGASYVALECGGFLVGLGLDVTVMVRSILLRGFDQDMANRAGEHMEEHGVKFLRKYVPVKVEELEAGAPGRLKVTAKSTETGEVIEEEYNTMPAPTRSALDAAGVKVNPKNGKVPVNDEEQTKRDFTSMPSETSWRASGSCDYVNVPTTVFTPLEYGSCGLSEEKALEMYGPENIEDRVIGFHYLGPNAGEVTQGYGVAIKCGVTKEQLDNTIGIHPTCAEIFTTLDVTKSSGGNIAQGGC